MDSHREFGHCLYLSQSQDIIGMDCSADSVVQLRIPLVKYVSLFGHRKRIDLSHSEEDCLRIKMAYF